MQLPNTTKYKYNVTYHYPNFGHSSTEIIATPLEILSKINELAALIKSKYNDKPDMELVRVERGQMVRE